MIHDEESGLTEPTIVINGTTLSFAEAMSVRVAVSSMRVSLHAPGTAKMLGQQLTRGYDRALERAEALMLGDPII